MKENRGVVNLQEGGGKKGDCGWDVVYETKSKYIKENKIKLHFSRNMGSTQKM